ncbi:MAG: hypothetical protein AAGA45_02415, partial [Verrucomicrobiota bacterium]
MVVLTLAGYASAQDKPTSITEILAQTEAEQTEPTNKQLRAILDLYEGRWTGSVDLTDKFGSVLQTMAVEKVYRIDQEDGRYILRGRFAFGERDEATVTTSETEIIE